MLVDRRHSANTRSSRAGENTVSTGATGSGGQRSSRFSYAPPRASGATGACLLILLSATFVACQQPDSSGPTSPLDPGADDPTRQTTSDDPAEECAAPDPAWIWCDDFEADRLDSYFEHGNPDGSFVRTDGVGMDGSSGMRARFAPGQVDAGSLKLAFGRTPQPYFDSVDEGTRTYRDVYWRFFVRYEPGWTGGGGYKLTRATSFVSESTWAQAMIAHAWSGSGENRHFLVLDPASGTDAEGRVMTTGYNDFDNLRWLGSVVGPTPIFDPDHVGQWRCVEIHVRLNDPDRADGLFELWLDDRLEARSDGLDWIGSFTDYGVNAVFLENYWNEGAPGIRERYFDRLVVSTERIGC